MIEKTFAETFANDWIAAWNRRDLNHILSHYTDDFTLSSPFIMERANEPSGMLRGKKAIGGYWMKSLMLRPNLKFELRAVFTGIDSVVIVYGRMDGRVGAECFEFDATQKVCRSSAHYG